MAAGDPVFRWLALFAAMRILFELCYDFLVVLGRSRALLLVQLAWIPVLFGAVVLGIHEGGTAGAALGLGLSSAVPLGIYLTELRRAGIGPLTLVRTLLPAACVAAATVGTYVLVSGVVSPWWASTAAGLVAGTCVLGSVSHWRDDLKVFRPTADAVAPDPAVLAGPGKGSE